MSHPNRNDPCPCGSGRKYKACHMREDERAARMVETLGSDTASFVRERTGEVARATPVWQADVPPLHGVLSDNDEPTSLVLVSADGLILMTDVLARRPVGAAARARCVLDGVMAAARSAGVLPERVQVRDVALANALRPEMERRGIIPEAAPLPALDEVLDSALEHLSNGPGGLVSTLWTWAETEATPAELAEFHAATAAYHRAAPWRLLSDADALRLRFPGDDEAWGASVMGGGSIHYGLALYSDFADLEDLLEHEAAPSVEWASTLRGISLSLSYDAAADLPRPMRREILHAGWEVDGMDACPSLLGIGIPGRRITADHLARVAQASRAVLAFVDTRPSGLPWRDPGTGVTVEAVCDRTEGVSLPPPLERSHPVGPAGPAADAAFVLRPDEEREAEVDAEEARYSRFEAWLAGQRLSKAARQRDARAAEQWSIMLQSVRVPAQAVTEHELRFFLYGWLVLEEPPPKSVARHLTRSLRRLFGWYAAAEGIEYPWAEAVLAELDGLVERAGADDVRHVLAAVTDSLYDDLSERALVPERDLPGTVLGWSTPFDERVMRLRDTLHRHWLLWHDEVVRGGVTDPASVRDILIGRQREWENRPHPALDGRTPREVVLEQDAKAMDTLSRYGLLPRLDG